MKPAAQTLTSTADPAQLVLNTIRHPVIMVDEKGYITFANADAESFFRSSSTILARNRLDQFIPFGSPLASASTSSKRRRRGASTARRSRLTTPTRATSSPAGRGCA